MSCPPPRNPLGFDRHNRQPTPQHLRGPIVEDEAESLAPLWFGFALGLALIPFLVWWA